MNKHAASLAMIAGTVLTGMSISAPTRAADSPASASSLLPARVMQAAHDRVAVGEYPMLVIGVVDGDKSRLYGLNAADSPAPSGKTVFEIGSITKTFTGLALAAAVKSKKLELDEPVAKLLPDFKIPSRDGKVITLGNLADQHSGLPRMPTNFNPPDPANPYAHYGAKKLKAFLANYTLSRAPGSEFEYSNLGFGLLGYAMAEHQGESYATLIEKAVLEPLDMKHCAVRISKTMKKQLAAGHDARGETTSNWDFGVLPGAGALRCSASDMLRYLKANMGVLKTKLYPAMRFAHEPRADGPGDNKVGLGWLILSHKGRKIIWHNGMTGGYASFIGFTADGQRGVVVLTNIQQSVDDLGMATLVEDTDLAPAHATIHMSPSQLQAYVGYYQFPSHLILTVFRDHDQLYTEATGQGALAVYPSARDEFFAKNADISISFLRGHGDKVVGLKVHQNGASLAKRVDAAAAAKTIGKTIVPLKPSTLKAYVGQYKFESGDVMDVTRKGDQLHAQLGNQPSMPIYPSAKDEFFYILVKAELSFKRDKSGRVTSLVLHQGGVNQKAGKVSEQ